MTMKTTATIASLVDTDTRGGRAGGFSVEERRGGLINRVVRSSRRTVVYFHFLSRSPYSSRFCPAVLPQILQAFHPQPPGGQHSRVTIPDCMLIRIWFQSGRTMTMFELLSSVVLVDPSSLLTYGFSVIVDTATAAQLQARQASTTRTIRPVRRMWRGGWTSGGRWSGLITREACPLGRMVEYTLHFVRIRPC